ncbi:MAG: alpha/beta hydrolase [bacterium]
MKGTRLLGAILALLFMSLTSLTVPPPGFARNDRDVPFRGMAERAEHSPFDAEAVDRLRNALPSYPHAWSQELHRGSEAPGGPESQSGPEFTRIVPGVGPEASGRGETLLTDVYAYWAHYRLGAESARRQLGAISVNDMRLAVQVFTPASTPEAVAHHPETPGERCTILYIHGYLDHTGLSRYAISRFLERGYTVVAMDMPGHGLSTGARGEIDDFSRYGMAVEGVIRAIRSGRINGLPEDTPLSGIAHSTGGSAFLEYIYRGGEELDRLVLAAPLVRLYAFPLARIGVRITSDILEDLPRRVSASSSNDEYIAFAQDHDPLAIEDASLEWSEAYLSWEESRRDFPVYMFPVLLLQPGDDTVVDTEYNTDFLSRSFPRLEYAEFEDARHAILNEPREHRRGLYERVDRFLDGRR